MLVEWKKPRIQKKIIGSDETKQHNGYINMQPNVQNRRADQGRTETALHIKNIYYYTES